MKTIEQLRSGQCTVIAKKEGQQREFNGVYDKGLEVVYVIIPYDYDIIGYRQD